MNITFKSTIISLSAISLATLLSGTAIAQCNCANASLIGDNVITQLGNNPSWSTSSTVGNTVELQNFGNSFVQNSSVPRWSVDYQSADIRIDFDSNGPATYGANFAFTFRDLNPQLPNCNLTPEVTGISVTTNNSAATWVSSGATFAANEVRIPFGPPTGNHDWMPDHWINVSLTYGCPGQTMPPDPDPITCCPPWSQQRMGAMWSEDNQGGFNDPYVAKLAPTPQINSQMQGFADYAATLDSNVASMNLYFALIDCNNNNPTNSCSPTFMPTGKRIAWDVGGAPNSPDYYEWNSGWSVIAAADIMDTATQASNVNNWYKLYGIPFIVYTDGRIEVPEDCPWVVTEFNRKRFPSTFRRKLPSVATPKTLRSTKPVARKELRRSREGKLLMRELKKILKSERIIKRGDLHQLQKGVVKRPVKTIPRKNDP